MKISFDCIEDIKYTISNSLLKYNGLYIKSNATNKEYTFIIDNDNIFLKFRTNSFCILDVKTNLIAIFYYEDIEEIKFYFV